MVKTIDFTLNQKKKDEQLAADYLAEKEIEDFNSIIVCLVNTSKSSYLFKEINFKKYYDMMIDDMKAQYINSDDTLTKQTINGIIHKYSELMDIDELVTELKKE